MASDPELGGETTQPPLCSTSPPQLAMGTGQSAQQGSTVPARLPHNESGVILRTSGLTRTFGSVRAVDGLDLTVRAGEVYGFLGVNGAGKTTSIRMLMGIIKADAGTIEILGSQSRRTTVRQKQLIGYVSQEQTFYPWMTCRALGRFVGGFYPTWDDAEFNRLLSVLDLPPDRKASQLSGGMRVKLALALAIAPRPALLILDEPTSGLDPVARREFLDLIRMQARQHKRTTFFSSHIIGEVERVADRIGVIHRGRMLYEGDLSHLKASVRQVRLLVPPEDSAGSDADVPALPTPSTPPTMVPTPSALLPPGFELLRRESLDGVLLLTVRAAPLLWESFAMPGAEVQTLSVEDIFIALVGTPAVAI